MYGLHIYRLYWGLQNTGHTLRTLWIVSLSCISNSRSKQKTAKNDKHLQFQRDANSFCFRTCFTLRPDRFILLYGPFRPAAANKCLSGDHDCRLGISFSGAWHDLEIIEAGKWRLLMFIHENAPRGRPQMKPLQNLMKLLQFGSQKVSNNCSTTCSFFVHPLKLCKSGFSLSLFPEPSLPKSIVPPPPPPPDPPGKADLVRFRCERFPTQPPYPPKKKEELKTCRRKPCWIVRGM